MDDVAEALVAELARKSSLCWVRYDPSTGAGDRGRDHAVWHVWHDDALCLVSDGEEQPLPEIPDGALVEVVMRSKDTGGRVLAWVGRVSVVLPEDEAWAGTTAALVAGRLNLRDPATAADRWAISSVVRRVTPTGDFAPAGG